MNEKVIVCLDTEETITTMFQQYCMDHKLYSDPIDIDKLKQNIAVFSGAIENYLIDHYGIDLEEPVDAPVTEREKGTDDYNKGWHEAIEKALKECYDVYIEGIPYRVIQEETLIGLGMSVLEREKGTDLEEIVKEIKHERAYRESRHETEEVCEVDVILRIIEPYMKGDKE